MRKYSNKNYKIVIETIPTNQYVRLMYADIKPTNSITILAPQPGIGKTTWAKRFIQENIFKNDNKDNFVVFAKNHDLLSEEYEPDLSPFGAIHWRGFKDMCNNDEARKIYIEAEEKDYLSPRLVGVLCDKICKLKKDEKDNCPYHTQFKERKLVLAPIQMMAENEDRFKYIFIDENYIKFRKIEKDYVTAKFIANGLFTALKKNDARYISNHAKYINIRYHECKETLIKARLWKNLSKLLDFNIKEQTFLVKNDLEFWYKPFLYNVFDAVNKNKNVKVIMLCATFNEEFFRDDMKYYAGEIGFDQETTANIYYTNIQNKDNIIYRINSSDNYRHSEPYKLDDIVQDINCKYTGIGLIGKKKFTGKIGFGVHFGNAEGTNNLENSDILIKSNNYVGNIEALVEEYKMKYMDFDRPKLPKRGESDNIYRWVQIHMGAKCADWIDWRNESINYDAIHRNRALWYDNKAIILFGDVPKKCYDEFTVIDVNPENTILPDRFTSDDLENVLISIIEKTKQKIKDAELEEQRRAEEHQIELEEQAEYQYEKGLEEHYNEPPEEPDPEDMDIPEIPDEPEPEEELIPEQIEEPEPEEA